MSDTFITNKNVIDNISDDGLYIRELVIREKTAGLSKLKTAHLGRLVTVFCYNSIDAYKNVIVREEGLHPQELPWTPFFKQSPLTPYFEGIVAGQSIRLQNLANVLTQVEGLKALRDFIAHGLTDESAKRFESKMEAMKKTGLLTNPQYLSIEDVNQILELESAVINLMGMGRALRTSDRNR